MKRILVSAIVAGGLLLGIGSTVTAAPDPDNACVGWGASTSAHQSHELLGSGLGRVLNEQGINPGDAIQAYATSACGKHGGI